MPARRTVVYRDARGRPATLVVEGTDAQVALVAKSLPRLPDTPAPPPTPVKLYALERMFGVIRRNGGFV